MKKKLPGMVWVFVGFVPWILFWNLSGPGLWTTAVLAGMIASLTLNAYRWPRRNFKALELITLIYFTVHLIFTAILGSSFFIDYGAILNRLTLAGMAWGTLLAGSPFTYQYAREDWDKAYWNDPGFRLVNNIITAAWGAIFLINAVLAMVATFFAIAESTKSWLLVILPNVGLVLGVLFSMRFPNWFVRWGIKREIEAREPYKWASPSFSAGHPSGQDQHDVIVIGSGIGGLSAAALLAKRGRKVIVFEQHVRAGGYCTSWERIVRHGNKRWRYVFDAGVHDVSGLGEHGPVRNLQRQLGIEEQIDWRLMSHEYLVDDIRIKVPHGTDEFARVLGEQFADERANIKAFFDEIEQVYRENSMGIEQTDGPNAIEAMLAYPKTHPHAYKWMEVPFEEMLDAYFRDPRLKEFLLMLTGYLSDDPSSLTVGSMAPVFGYYFDGGYYPAGGPQVFANALVSVIKENRGEVRLGASVGRIIIENRKATGVMLANGERHYAKAIISNADVWKTFRELVGYEHLPKLFVKKINTLEPSTSAFVVFLGIDCVPDISSITMIDEICIVVPSKVDLSLAPPGHSAITLIKLVPQAETAMENRKAPGYTRYKQACGDEMIALAEQVIPNLRQHIVYRQEGAPPTFARYDWTTRGAIYGPAEGQSRLPMKTPIEKLYLVGAGTRYGAGVEAVVLSGVLAANAIYRRSSG